MSLLKIALSIGAGILATAACYLGLSTVANVSGKEECLIDNNPQTDNNNNPIVNGKNKSEALLRKLDKVQVCVINFARFVSEVVRSISLFVRAMRCYEYDVS